MTEAAHLPEEDYRQLREFISRTPRGNAFLLEHERRARTMATAEVYRLISDLRDAWREHMQVANATKHIDVLRRELQDMSASISQARREISALRPKEGDDRFLSATNELDAIVLSTERASIEILNAAEHIMEMVDRLRAVQAPALICEALESEVTNIFTACSFQDLTGQRTTKVVNALRYIEQRIHSMMSIWDIDGSGPSAGASDPQDKRPDAHLLNGPAMEGAGMDQGDIDRLLNGLLPASPPPAAAPAPRPTSAAAQSGRGNGAVPEEEPQPTPLDQSAIDSLFG